MKTIYKRNSTHSYCLGVNPDYKFWQQRPSLFFGQHKKYWVGVGKLSEYGVEYDGLAHTDDFNLAKQTFDQKGAAAE